MNSKQIIITFITLITLIGTGWYCYSKFKSTTSNSQNEPINTIEENTKQKNKPTSIEEPKEIESSKPEVEPKISISQARFDEIKNYILSLDDNLLPKNLNPNEKTKIEEIRTSIKSTIQRKQNEITKAQKEIDDHNKNLSEIATKLQKPKISRTEIRTLEIDREAIDEMLVLAKDFKRDLENRFNKSCIENDGLGIITQLNKIYKIN